MFLSSYEYIEAIFKKLKLSVETFNKKTTFLFLRKIVKVLIKSFKTVA